MTKWFKRACSDHDSLLLWFLTSPLLNFDESGYQLVLKKIGLELLITNKV
jgi:hypothetical protein